MDEKHHKPENADAREDGEDVREAVVSADDTGLIAGEELITEAETVPRRQPPA